MSGISELSRGRVRFDGLDAPSGLADRVRRTLRDTGHVHCLGVEVREIEGQVVLSGRVPSYYAWQVAHSAACAAVGPGRVRNELDVAPRIASRTDASPVRPFRSRFEAGGTSRGEDRVARK